MREIEYLIWQKLPSVWEDKMIYDEAYAQIRQPVERITNRIEGNIIGKDLYDNQADSEENS